MDAQVHAPLSHWECQATALYWQPRLNGLSAGIREGEILTPSFDLNWGWAVEAGYRFSRDQWRVLVSGCFYRSHVTSELSGPLEPGWVVPGTGASGWMDQANEHYRLHLGVGDLLLERGCWARGQSMMQIQWGLRGASVRQKYHIEYEATEQHRWRMKAKFEGIGPVIKALAYWGWNPYWGLCGELGGSVLYGSMYTHQGERLVSSQVKQLRLFNHSMQSVALIQMRLGIQAYLFGRKGSVGMGWSQWWISGQNALPLFLSSQQLGQIFTHQGDLSLRGVDLRFSFYF